MSGKREEKVPERCPGKKRFVLVVDSNQRDAYYTAMLLQNLGYTSTIARSGEEALELITVAAPSLVITELVLPGMNGFDLFGRLAGKSGNAAVPVVILTRFTSVESEDRCRQLGTAGCLNKPLQSSDLYRTVQQATEPTPRQNIRIPVTLPVTIGGPASGPEHITMLSDAGVFIRTLTPRPGGSRHTITFVLEAHVIRVEAHVLYKNRFDDGPHREPGMALKFLDLSPVDLGVIQNYIRAHVSPGFAPGDGTTG